MYVVKRDGSHEQFSLEKTRQVISWACEGLSVNPLELESHIDITFKPGISTSFIQENLISHSLSLVTLSNSDWLRVAANLRMMSRYKIYRDINFRDFCTKKILSGEYSERLTRYSNKDLFEAFSWIDKEYDKNYDYAGANVLCNKFMLKDEPLQYLYLASALVIASYERFDQLDFAHKLYNSFSLKKISLPSPTLSGLRKGKANLASCFVGSMGDSLDSIFETVHKVAKISKNGGGVGLYIGDIRCNGSWIQGVKGAASGVIGWIKILNDTVVAVNQLGQRAGALTIGLPIWHYDVEEFLKLQTEHGDSRKKAFDILPQLIMSDEFYYRYENDDFWYCFDPYEVKVKLGLDLTLTSNYNKIVERKDELELVKEHSAKSLYKQVLQVIVETSLPYMVNIDTINRNNPNKHCGYISAVNLCNESFSNTTEDEWHTCSLISLNLANIEPDELGYYSDLAVHALDNILDICEYPIKESESHVDNYRTIGVGVMGLADYLAKEGYTYESAYKEKFLSDTFEMICYSTIVASINLAKTRGPYTKFKGSMWSTGELINNYKAQSNCDLDWDKVQSNLDLYGIRNSQLMSPAPNTTSSLVQGCVAGVLPPYNLLHYDDSSNGAVAIVPQYISDYPLRYKAYRNYDMLTMIDYIAEMQKWVDTGISFECLFNLTTRDDNDRPIVNATYIRDFIVKSWKSRIKANYYFRYITNQDTDKFKTDCPSCSG